MAAPSPAVVQQAAPSPAGPFGCAAASPGGPFGRPAAPAFLPPYLQPAASGGAGGGMPSDHPALVHSPDVTNSSFNTLETRRVSVDARRMSVNSRRFSMQDATGRLLAVDDLSGLGGGATGGLLTGGTGHLATVAEAPGSGGLSPAAGAPASGAPRSRRRSSGTQCEWAWAELCGKQGMGAVLLHACCLWRSRRHACLPVLLPILHSSASPLTPCSACPFLSHAHLPQSWGGT